ncbi:hypothetical protein [Enterococcus columbae]|uniref:hypothetical protein n=1 Tax=Enterococcus columbae TaxID=1355 RepID=UPI000367E88F|nr:hypothetical protein [Enterococcus columbae]OJG21449.1 hypothetical protein RR47_GL001396 [Enterococcus columbae DSM 7374 = ATCC 51263]
MLSREEVEKIYQERIDSESWHGPYTEEEISIQKERRKKIEKYKKLFTDEQQKLKK